MIRLWAGDFGAAAEVEFAAPDLAEGGQTATSTAAAMRRQKAQVPEAAYNREDGCPAETRVLDVIVADDPYGWASSVRVSQ